MTETLPEGFTPNFENSVAWVKWVPSKSGKVQIALGRSKDPRDKLGWKVWGIYTGTHDIARITAYFGENYEAARKHANGEWHRC